MEPEPPISLAIRSSAFAPDERIPVRYTGDGSDVSPPLAWQGVPIGARELVVVCDDPDAPTESPWVHWILYKVPATASALEEGAGDFCVGRNSWGRLRYQGPMPPKGHGVHHYHFRLYALDTELEVEDGLTKDEVQQAMHGHILAAGVLIGTYERR